MIRDEIRHIHDPRMYVRLLEDCFSSGIDLTHSYTALVEMCVHQIHHLTTACQLHVGEQELESKDIHLKDFNESHTELIPLMNRHSSSIGLLYHCHLMVLCSSRSAKEILNQSGIKRESYSS